MPATQLHRIFRLVVLAVAGSVLLMTGYVGSVGILAAVDGVDALPYAYLPDCTDEVLDAYYAPLEWYAGNELPGTEALEAFYSECEDAGGWLADR